MGGIRGDGQTAIFQIRVANVGLIALVIAAEGEGVAAVCPRGIIANIVGIADESAVRKVADGEIVGDREIPDAAFGLRKLEDV